MNIKQEVFLQSGIIEDYCLGIAASDDVIKLLDLCDQYPDAQKILNSTTESFDKYISSFAKKPPIGVSMAINQILIENLKLESTKLKGSDQMMSEFVSISQYSKVDQWEKLVENISPPEEYGNLFIKSLFESETHELALVWVKEIVPDEIHVALSESFFILDGTVDCYVENDVFPMQKGGFMQIPLDVSHHVIVTSSTPAKAIMSRVMI